MTTKHGDQVSTTKSFRGGGLMPRPPTPALMVGGFIFVLESRACCFCGGLSALQRVKAVLKVVVSSWGMNAPTCSVCGRMLGLVWTLSLRSAAIALLLVHYDPGQYFHGQCVSGDEGERISVVEGTVAELFDVFVEVCCYT